MISLIKGNSQYIASSNFAMSTTNRTFCLWLYCSSISSPGYPAFGHKKEDTGANRGFCGLWIYSATNKIYSTIGNGTSSTDTPGYTFPYSEWHHWACVINGGNWVKTYKDGIEVDTVNTALNPFTNAVPVHIGKWVTFYLTAKIFDFRVYDRVLTPTELLILTNMVGYDDMADGLKCRYLLSDKSDGINSDNSEGEIRDISGNGNHGTCFNTPTFYAASLRLHRSRR